MSGSAAELLGRFVEHHVAHGTLLPPEELCAGRPELLGELRGLIRSYLAIDRSLELGDPAGDEALPSFPGFRTVERLGRGGMGEVYKLRDLRLGRTVAAKVVREGAAGASARDFLAEARAMALFDDDRIVRILEARLDADPPFLLMEYVDGFELGEVGPSLEPARLARLFVELCEALQHAHDLGLQHRDLKPGNVLLDQRLRPKLLDFGLSGGDPSRGHLRGTPAYMAPEQLDPAQPLDARTDLYALGVMLYELLTGAHPYAGLEGAALLAAVRAAEPRLPAELKPGIPEPLSAIALKAMERDARHRYASAREMALDLTRFLDGRPVLARPTHYGSALGRRLTQQLSQVEEWLRLRLIYPHEARELRAAYGRLERREDDWIVESRNLSYSQIALYLGAVLVTAGGLLYFGADRFFDAVEGLLRPALVLGLPFAALLLLARALERRGHHAVAVAYDLGGVLVLPLFLLIALHETGLGSAPAGTPGQLFPPETLSNRQLQLALSAPCVFAFWLALRTRTVALGSVFTSLATLFALSLLTDFGLGGWLDEGRWDLLALRLLPLALVLGALGRWLERLGVLSLCRPLYVAAALLFAASLELTALDGRAFRTLGFSVARFHDAPVPDPVLLDTLAAMVGIGLLLYATASLVERFGTEAMAPVATMLFAVSPFATLEPLFALSRTGSYSRRFDWLYLALALGVTFLSHHRQRKSFYYAGLLNTCGALWLISSHHDWFDRPSWATAIVAAGLALLFAGYALDVRERRRRASA